MDNEASKAGYTWIGKTSKSWPKTEGDGVQFPWTYAPQGLKGHRRLLWFA